MKLLQIIKTRLVNWECTYANGKKSKCWKFNIADIFDPTAD